MKLFQTGDKFGKQQANGIMKGFATSTMPEINDIDPYVPFFFIPEASWKFSDGTNFHNIGTPELAIPAITGQGVVDQNNNLEIMIQVPDPLQSATMKLLGLQFPSWVYTEYPAISGTFWSTTVCDSHDHTGTASGTTSSDSHDHDHMYTPGSTGSIPTSSDSHSHNHAFNNNFTTSPNTIQHKHQTTVSFSGSTQKTTFSASLLQIYITTDRASWGSAKSIDISSLYSTNGTGHIDISSHLTPGSTNYIRFNLNTASAVGGTISYLFQFR